MKRSKTTSIHTRPAGALVLLAWAAWSGGAHAQVTLYGLVDAAVQTSDGYSAGGAEARVTRLISGGIQGSRYGFKGSEDLGGGLKAVFELENQFAVDSGAARSASQAFSRKAAVGLAGGFGRLTAGRHTTVSYDAQADLDPVQFASFTPLGNSGDAPVVRFADYQVVNARRDNSIKLGWDGHGITAGAMLALGEVVGDTRAGRSLGVRLGYTAGGFSGQVAFDEARDAAGSQATGTTVGGLYTLGSFTVHLGTVRVKKDFRSAGGFGQKNDVWWLGGRYAITPQLALHAGYYDQTQRGTATSAGAANPAADGKARTLSLLADYMLSKRSDVYLAVQNTQLKDGSVAVMAPNGTSDSITTAFAGIRHKF